MFEFYFFILGACLGSFANVVIYRLPKGESIVSPRSRCGHCQKPVVWYDNIPLLSWFLLRGKCRNCQKSYSFRYVLVEFIMATLFVLAYQFVGLNWHLLEILILFFGLVTVSFIDLDHFILPDVFTLPGIVIGLVGALLIPQRSFLDAFLGAFIGGGILWAIAYLYLVLRKQEGMGGGDIKLLAWIGAVLGWKAIPFVIISSSLIGSVIGILFAVKSKKGLQMVIPFGPYLALGAVLHVIGGEAIGLWYLELFFPFLNSQ